MPCLRLLISGRVQGVWFRESMRQEADRLGATGWVRNLPDGRVEAIVCGKQDGIEAILAWARNGPPLARVSSVETTPAHGDFSTFEKR
ncbi:MAG: acylphosphatase [Thiobacillaceae bacterium]|jgi:acylphosphatase